jgi:type IV secretion system protein VirB11
LHQSVAETIPSPGDPATIMVRTLMRPITPTLERADVNEVSINRPGELWAMASGRWERVPAPELTAQKLDALCTAVISFNKMQDRPIVSVLLPGGERGQIVRPPACLNGTWSITIRKHTTIAKTLEELDGQGAFNSYVDVSFNQPTQEEAEAETKRGDFGRLEGFEVELLALKREGRIQEFLREAVLAHRNVVVAGKTLSGKTTLMRSMIREVPDSERVITIEDVHELMLPDHPNRVHMLYGEGQGRMTADACLASCMRQSPDRIFLAELRGNEAWEYLNSLNTGHPGAITSTHANNALQTFERIAMLVKKSEIGRQLELSMIRNVLFTTIDVVLFIRDRRLVEIFYDPIFSKSKMGG